MGYEMQAMRKGCNAENLRSVFEQESQPVNRKPSTRLPTRNRCGRNDHQPCDEDGGEQGSLRRAIRKRRNVKQQRLNVWERREEDVEERRRKNKEKGEEEDERTRKAIRAV